MNVKKLTRAFCGECGKELPVHAGVPLGACVILTSGEELFWCSPKCLTRVITRVRTGETRDAATVEVDGVPV
jgi:hypothetical protein